MEIYNKPSGGGGGGKGGGTSSSGGTSAQPGVSVPAKKPKGDVDFAPMLLVAFIAGFAFIIVLWFLMGKKK